VRASGATTNASVCAASLSTIASSSGALALGLGDVYSAQTTKPPFKTRDVPRLQIAAGKRLIQRFVTGEHAVGALLLAIRTSKGFDQFNPVTVCIKDVASGAILYRAAVNLTTRDLSPSGWTRLALPAPLRANATFDVAMTNVVPSRRGAPPVGFATWLTRSAVLGGGGRIGTWGYVHARMNASSTDNNSCCVQDWSPNDEGRAPQQQAAPLSLRAASALLAPTLASRLEDGMRWQLGLANATAMSESGESETTRFGILIVEDAFHNGVPITGMATCSASSMWDQIRMGWKSMYINTLFLASLDAWIELEDAGVVRSLQTLVGISASVVRAQVAADIEAQFGYSIDNGGGDVAVDAVGDSGGLNVNRGYVSWISCNATTVDGALSSCPRDRSSGGGQRAVNTQMIPDMAWAVQLGLGGANARRRFDDMLARGRSIGGNSGMVINNLIPQESIDPRIVSSADKWDPVDENHFCSPAANGSMVYTGHCVCATDESSHLPPGEGAKCYGNFGQNQQNGGKFFATQATVFLSGPYIGSLDDFHANLVNLRTIIAQLRSVDPAATPLLNAHRGYFRKRIPNGALRTMCLIEHVHDVHDVNGSTLDKDAWGEDVCSYNKDVTFGLRTGPRLMLIGFAFGHLGLRVGVNGTLLLYRQPVAPDVATMNVLLPADVAARWPAELGGVRVGGVRVGARRVDVECNASSSVQSAGAANGALRCQFEWDRERLA
tara:strand:+ start:4407 stop:6572 length:2166 start_codon:yes stop_codon:yes gene_type:complete